MTFLEAQEQHRLVLVVAACWLLMLFWKGV
jgi:hypothetical protein